MSYTTELVRAISALTHEYLNTRSAVNSGPFPGPALQRGPGGPRPTQHSLQRGPGGPQPTQHFRPDDVIVTWRNR